MIPLLDIKRLSVSIAQKEIIHRLDLQINPGEITAIMGPNGSGKSTLAMALAGYPKYKIELKNSQVKINGEEISKLTPDERAKRGLFLAFQQPIAIPGVKVSNLLRLATNKVYEYQSQHRSKNTTKSCPTGTWLKTNDNEAKPMTVTQFLTNLKKEAKELALPEEFLQRYLNDGFSGGEKKKMEALQALLLKPKVAIFDEIDTGLDIDALKIVASAIAKLAKNGTAVIVITHYQRILKYLKPNKIHILVSGRIVKSGTGKLAVLLEKQGYTPFLN